MMQNARTLLVALMAAVVLGSGTAAGQTALPRPGATYRGRITETAGKKVLASQRIFFRVDRKGRTVRDFTLRDGYPVYCNPKGIGEVQSTAARVFVSGKFRVKLPIYAKHHHRQGSLIVTGTFAPHDRESGLVKTMFTARSRQSCNGTAHYTTQVRPTG